MADLAYEEQFWQKGYALVAGVDEAGRGPLAGPVVAAAVILPSDCSSLSGLTDSKKLTPSKRQFFLKQIQIHALDYSVGIVTADLIDRINILQATKLAMWRALSGLIQVDHALIDGNQQVAYWSQEQTCLIKGDALSLSIAAASVLAKETRDAIMVALAQKYPGYGFEKHKGYPTKMHREAVLKLGLSRQHRRSFCKKLLEKNS